MRKNQFFKKDGKMPENMPFKKGDIVTYVKYEDGETKQRDVLLFEAFDGDTIIAKAAIKSTESWDALTTTPTKASVKWEDGCRLRYALSYEMRAFINALVKRL